MLAVHPLLFAANPFHKLDFGQQLELLKQRRAIFEALRPANGEGEEEGRGAEEEGGEAGPQTETPIDLSCK